MKGFEYVLREMTADEVKKTQLEILDVVMAFCEERGISCWLNGGTLLGAVRHKGYIPWDDDIDLGMLRPDYDRFMAEFNGTNPRYEFHCYENDPGFFFAFGKVYDNHTVLHELDESGFAVHIDIFVMDNAPDDDEIVRDMFEKRHQYIRAINCLREGIFGSTKGSIFRRISVSLFRFLWMAQHFFPSQSEIPNYARKIVENSRRYVNEKTKRVGDFVGFREGVCLREDLERMTRLEFEGKMYNAPAGWDKWLTALYGDYMTPPSEKERIPTHKYKSYWKD